MFRYQFCPFHFVLLDEKGLPLNSYYTIFPFPFPVLIGFVFRYFLDFFCYLFLGYPLEYRFHFFSAYIVPFHDYFCGCLLLAGSLPYFDIFTYESVPLQKNRAYRLVSIRSTLCYLFNCDCSNGCLDKLQVTHFQLKIAVLFFSTYSCR